MKADWPGRVQLCESQCFVCMSEQAVKAMTQSLDISVPAPLSADRMQGPQFRTARSKLIRRNNTNER
jgi:hypothetical protein